MKKNKNAASVAIDPINMAVPETGNPVMEVANTVINPPDNGIINSLDLAGNVGINAMANADNALKMAMAEAESAIAAAMGASFTPPR